MTTNASPELTEEDQKRLDEAVKFCVDIGMEGWKKAVAGRVADCLTNATFRRLFGRRQRGDCKFLAKLAKEILNGKKKLHEIVGRVVNWIAGRLGAEPIERTVARELAQRIRIPVVDGQAVVVARGLQMIGILYCISGNIPLDRCPSFIDLARAETTERSRRSSRPR